MATVGASLDTVGDMVRTARTLLMDTVEPYRYLTTDLLTAINISLLEARRLRPDLFLWNPNSIPTYGINDVDTEEVIPIDQQYRSAILYYIVGFAQLRDEEDTSDVRAATLMNSFTLQMLSVATQVGVPGAA